MTPCIAQAPRTSTTRRKRTAAIDWRLNLPKEWQRLVVAPLATETYRDYEMAAERIIGRDEDEQPCYCRSRFVVTEMRSDDDEEFYQVVAYAELLSAWRLRDGRWLIYRLIKREGERGSGFYSFSYRMPR